MSWYRLSWEWSVTEWSVMGYSMMNIDCHGSGLLQSGLSWGIL